MEKHKILTKMQKDHMNHDLDKSERDEIHQSWFREDTIDYWRHRRMYETISPLAKYYKDANWLSIGDGRYGLDSHRLNQMFKINVFPTDISEAMLCKGKEIGLFEVYGIENAESLTFKDNSFDILFCKEAFHHFARPIIALYEMIRVSKYAVILIEPNDNHGVFVNKSKYLVSAIKIIINRIINRKYTPYLPNTNDICHSYEDSGNYVYSVSNLEINKIIHAMDLGGMAFYEFNDSYLQGVEFGNIDRDSLLFQEIKRNIKELDRSGSKNLTTTIIFKTKISSDLRDAMINYGYKFPEKIDNPIIKNI